MENKFTYLEPSLEKQLKGHRNAITSLFFSPNEQQIASSSLDNSVLLWDLRGTMRSYRFQGHDEAVMDVTFSPSGKYMASASRDKTVRLWVPTVTGSTGMFKAHSQTVRSVQFSPDGTKIITGSDDKIVKLWSTDKHKFIASFVGHTNWVRCARMSCDGSVIASCSDDKATKLWNPDNSECIHTYKDQKGHGLCLAWHPSGCYIAVGTSHGNVKLYDVRTHNLVQYYSIHNDAVTQIAFHPSGSYILTSSKDGKMKILDLLEGHPIFTLSGHTGAINAVNFSASGDTFASAGDDKLVFIWKTNFTELTGDTKENDEQINTSTNIPKSTSQTSKFTYLSKGRSQGTKAWQHCYHTNKIPVTTFVHLDDVCQSSCDSMRKMSYSEEPNANSTMIDPGLCSQTEPCLRDTYSILNRSNTTKCTKTTIPKSFLIHPINPPRKNETLSGCPSNDCSLHSVGHMSHIPRIPPSPTTYTLPSVLNNSMGTCTQEYAQEEEMYGMIKLKDNDICYTSGAIEWVGRKRNFPINSGFKVITEQYCNSNKTKIRKLDKTYSCDPGHKDCDCADVLPTVNAIVDHLNALHEAVDIVDLRLNTLEHVLSNKE